MLATGLGACSQELDHYETLAFFVIYFVLKILISIQKQDACEAYAYFFPEKECNLITVLV